MKQDELIQNLEKIGTIQKEYKIVIFSYTSKDNKPCVKLFSGKRTKASYHYSFGSENLREDWINKRIEQANDIKKRALEQNIKYEKENETLQEGKILVSSWGYEQTNIDFYLIVSRKSKTLTLQRIGSTRTYTSDMSGTCVPDTENKIGDIFTKRVSKYGGVKFSSFEHAILWDGKKESFSTWA